MSGSGSASFQRMRNSISDCFLNDGASRDWGVSGNPRSPRAGLLTLSIRVVRNLSRSDFSLKSTAAKHQQSMCAIARFRQPCLIP
jgi:hypothetical protein